MQATKKEKNLIHKVRKKGGNMNLIGRRTSIKGQKEEIGRINWP